MVRYMPSVNFPPSYLLVQCNPNKNANRHILVDIDKMILKCMWEYKESKIVKAVLWRTKLEDLQYHDVHTLYRYM